MTEIYATTLYALPVPEYKLPPDQEESPPTCPASIEPGPPTLLWLESKAYQQYGRSIFTGPAYFQRCF